MKYSPKNDREKLLIKALINATTPQHMANLLRDLLTPAEITEFANRITIANLLLKKKSYLEIAKQVGVSTTTVTRVAHWLNNGCEGYKAVLK